MFCFDVCDEDLCVECGGWKESCEQGFLTGGERGDRGEFEHGFHISVVDYREEMETLRGDGRDAGGDLDLIGGSRPMTSRRLLLKSGLSDQGLLRERRLLERRRDR